MDKETYLYLSYLRAIRTSNSSFPGNVSRFSRTKASRRGFEPRVIKALVRMLLSRRLPRLVPSRCCFNPAYYFARPFRRHIPRDSLARSRLILILILRRERGRGSIESYQGLFIENLLSSRGRGYPSIP